MNKKYAVCVGINDYPGSANDLAGCVNDALDWSTLLRGEGYDVHTILDADATHEKVTGSLRDALSSARFGDRVVFTYSGHGTWVPDRNGDEPDKRDEAMCLYDFQSGGLFIDDEVNELFSGAKRGVGALILSDSCFSGTVSRFVSMVGTPQTVGTPRFIPPHTIFEDLTEDQAAAAESRSAGVPRKTSSLISGCSDTEYSYDAHFGARPNGAFTRAAIDAFQSGASLSRWFRSIRQTLPSTQYPQTPQLTAASSYRKYTRAL